MNIKVGCDLVHIEKFKQSIERTGELILEKIFCKQELLNSKKLESLAGIFAAKEATIKALQISTDNWLNIEILKQTNGKPTIKLNDLEEFITCDLSISHDGKYALAMVTFLTRE
jgi:holo-[acyl-carrier protein] synthase